MPKLHESYYIAFWVQHTTECGNSPGWYFYDLDKGLVGPFMLRASCMKQITRFKGKLLQHS